MLVKISLLLEAVASELFLFVRPVPDDSTVVEREYAVTFSTLVGRHQGREPHALARAD